MALQNRVAPDGQLLAVEARGMFMGNRGGRIHDPETQRLTGRSHASKRWLCCALAYKGWQRDVWGKFYTELFFMDEVTSLAAGHRPCFLCRREAADRFVACWQKATGADAAPSADEMDAVLHAQRLGHKRSRKEPLWVTSDEDWPDGVLVRDGNAFFARQGGRWLRWSVEGYDASQSELSEQVEMITPLQIVEVLRAGYAPQWHASYKEL